jgi:hypothetical protein
MAETAKNPMEGLVCFQDFLKTREQILRKIYPKISRRKRNPDLERLMMMEVGGLAVEDGALWLLDRDIMPKAFDKASEKADRVSKETFLASEGKKGRGGKEKGGEEEAIGFPLHGCRGAWEISEEYPIVGGILQTASLLLSSIH